jgi:hypothetical protein
MAAMGPSMAAPLPTTVLKLALPESFVSVTPVSSTGAGGGGSAGAGLGGGGAAFTGSGATGFGGSGAGGGAGAGSVTRNDTRLGGGAWGRFGT